MTTLKDLLQEREEEIGTTEKTPSTTFKDLLRELEELQERLEDVIANIK